ETPWNQSSVRGIWIEQMSDQISDIEQLGAELDQARRELERYRTWVEPGHALSPIPSPEHVKLRESEIYAVPREMPGLNLNEAGQLGLFDELLAFYPEQPFKAQQTEG